MQSPPYTEQNDPHSLSPVPNAEDRSEETPPPYEPRTDPAQNPKDNASKQKVNNLVDSETSKARSPAGSISENIAIADPPSSSSATATTSQQQQEEEHKSDSSPFSFVRNMAQAHEDKKKAKEAAKKVDFYERNYGFVPKNVMTEAEWKRVRKDAPKVKVPFELKGTTFFGPR